jgi:hypothetical protein
VPVTVMVAFPTVAFAAAVRVTLCGMPGARAGVAGAAVTPAGRPLIETATIELKPLLALTLMVSSCEDPAVTERLLEERVRVKSGEGLLSSGGDEDEDEEPPHPIHTITDARNR